MKINKKALALIILISIVGVFIALNAILDSDDKMDISDLREISAVENETLQKLSSKKIFLGHQSIGFEIINGIELIQTKHSKLTFKFIESSSAAVFASHNFLHARVGRNCDPKSKIDAFAKIINAGIGNNAEIAGFKLCFVDVNENTDAQDIFNHYKIIMDQLELNFPKTKFIHFTMPLVSKRLPLITRIKNIVKYFLGRYIVSSKLNGKRNEFNELMRNAYGGTGNLFDMANIESSEYQKHNERSTNTSDGIKNDAIRSEYTYDGGHLNTRGRLIIAEQLLLHLINTTK